MPRPRVVPAALTPRASLAVLAALAIAATTLAAFRARTQQVQEVPAGFRDEFLHQFDNSMTRLVALAEALPAERYAWRPGAGVMPLARIYAHIARFNYHYPATAMGIVAPARIDPDTLERVAEKTQVVALLRRSAEHVRRAVRAMPDGQLGQATTLYDRRVPQWAVLLQLLAHMNDHLGQSIAYARVNGVVPPWSQ